ncbi:uncharacterized protein LOC124934915 [Impatiens glandulifera]|uniref:uncharacterized protein LOC124934915 n=1 Tax=Impatiens glandulifera TaxID=253017 RepID=UPI001FB0EAE5|nr:uncharacterized protein LOC124934915 [Impatiens glandulifera]
MDLAIQTEQPTTPTVISSPKKKAKFEKWGVVCEDTTNAKDYLAEIEKRFIKSDKAETSTILKSLISMKYKGNDNIREYIIEMSNLASKLKALKLNLHENLLVHLIMISLLVQFNHFKEERLKQERAECAHLTSTSKDKGRKRKNVDVAQGPNTKKKVNNDCFFLQ